MNPDVQGSQPTKNLVYVCIRKLIWSGLGESRSNVGNRNRRDFMADLTPRGERKREGEEGYSLGNFIRPK